jgi:4-alpha-glucanotransferase
MNDDFIRTLASKAGVDVQWRDQKGEERPVSIETLRAILQSIGLPCSADDELKNSLSLVELGARSSSGSQFITARVGQPVSVPFSAPPCGSIEIEFESGAIQSVTPIAVYNGLVTLPAFTEPGYHKLRNGNTELTLATAPERCITSVDIVGDQPLWGLAAQIYGLRRNGDYGVGDFGAAAALATAAAARGADVLALSPVHALFAAEPRHFSPYSPSSRLFYNPIYADPRCAFPEDVLQNVIGSVDGLTSEEHLVDLKLVDWPAAARARSAVLRALYALITSAEYADATFRQDFDRFRRTACPLLIDHATFESLHAFHLAQSSELWAWTNWAPELQDPSSIAVTDFAAAHRSEVDFHVFCQWIVSKSFADCQRTCRESGMRIGLVADLAIGMEASGSHVWSRRKDVLTGVSLGAPPDYYNAAGQNWGLTGFSPRGLQTSNFSPFIETLRASFRFAGGIRIDHVMGMSRLWLIPQGARATEGAYLEYPSETLFRLIALESWRHKAIVIGEDLGTLPDGFRDYLRSQGIAGLRVVRFERDDHGFRRASDYDSTAVASTSTHDLIPMAGWWAGTDAPCVQTLSDQDDFLAMRAWDREVFWAALEASGVAKGERPAPQNTDPIVDAAISFVAKTPCRIRLLPIEDALGICQQPNVPGTTVEKPNWRQRYDYEAARLLDQPHVDSRLQRLQEDTFSTDPS